MHDPTGGHAELTDEVRTSISGLLDWTQQNLDEWSDSVDEKEYACPICGQGILEDETGVSKLFNEARPLMGLPRVYFFHATLHFDLRFLTALERVTSNAQPCFTSYEHVATASDSAANSRPLTGIEQHRGPHHRCQIAGDGQAQRWIPLDLESEQIRLVKSEILAGSVTIQFTTQPSDPQEIFIVPATAPFILVIDGSPLVALGRRFFFWNVSLSIEAPLGTPPPDKPWARPTRTRVRTVHRAILRLAGVLHGHNLLRAPHKHLQRLCKIWSLVRRITSEVAAAGAAATVSSLSLSGMPIQCG